MNEEVLKKLKGEFGFWEYTAQAFLESKGTCGYCGENLFKNRLRYYSMELDHLLPKSIYVKFANHRNNFVLACKRCNNLKRSLDVLLPDEDPELMLENKKSELVSRVKDKLLKRKEADEKLLANLHELLGWE